MPKRLTIKEKIERIQNKIIDRIKTIEKFYGIENIRLACQKYAISEREELKLRKEISDKEKELSTLKNGKRKRS